MAITLFSDAETALAAEQQVDLELVLAIDVSGSVDDGEYMLQTEGLALAFEHPDILAAIKRAGEQGITLAVVQWSSPDEQWVAVNWIFLRDETDLAQLGNRLRSMPRRFIAGDTVLSKAMKFSGRLFTDNGFSSRRQVIDVSGDGGVENLGITRTARDELVSAGIVINGLAIETDVDNLEEFYGNNVVGGVDSFVMTVANYQDFDTAIRRKLIREIAPLRLSRWPGKPIVLAKE
ncbi:DUF1194 domain-containing protein [Sneathiella marina]|uniref:DUF1194 domain-containing protein n=1 Tax=Sneathiella marina TaxID=2950108 RepID=A0ABY4W624_9PROT|nr:DUF1194 domain-containing protein [Sneathiella marina]USG62631.1 DUF1194 domain-containing protein [Sneathiella marina]